MSINIKLTRISSSHNNLRTDSVIGSIAEMPAKGDEIFVVASSLEGDEGHRVINTTPVVAIINGQYHTRNSVYEIEVLPQQTEHLG